MSSDHRDERTIMFFFYLNDPTSLYRWLYETWHESTATSTCSDGENFFTENLNLNLDFE